MSTITQSMGQLRTSETEPMNRPGFGIRGKAIRVKANAYKVVTPKNLTAYHYDVKIAPEEKRPPRLNRAIWKELIRTHQPFGQTAVVYDGRYMAYAAAKLPAFNNSFKVDLPESDGSPASKGNVFNITITLIGPIDLGALRTFVTGGQGAANLDPGLIMSALQALNVAVQHGPMLTFPSRGASFFLSEDQRRISKGLEMWRGYYTSLRLGPGHAFINIDLSSQPMIMHGNLPDVMIAFAQAKAPRFGPEQLSTRTMPPQAAIELSRFLRNLKVIIKVKDQQGREQHRKIKELSKLSAADSKFTLENGQQTNVAAYMKKQYGVTVQHPDWPCVRVSKVALWPIELCEVQVGQKYGKKLDPTQTAESLKFTTIGPRDRLPLLRQGIDKIRPTNAGSPLNQWGLQIETTPMEVPARLLPAPDVVYKNKTVKPGAGTWDLRGLNFSKTATVERWMVFVFDRENFFPRRDVQASVQGLIEGLSKTGIRVMTQQPTIVYGAGVHPDRIGQFMHDEAKKQFQQAPHLFVCYLPRKPCDEYAAIKRFGDQEVGVATQCLAIPKVKRGNPQYYANVAMKVNVKLNGTNSVVNLGPAVAGKPTMIFGLDVSHPAPGSFAPSVAAVVGTINREFTNYGSSIRLQPSRVECIADIGEMVKDLLKQFHQTVKTKPQRLIFFRDGVSEGQFSQVMDQEINAIRIACQSLETTYRPEITYIVCGKRHHISLFPVRAEDGDRTGNVQAGTTVDRDITSAYQFDWYTQSHASLLGTSRSAHYTVLVDDSKFSADVLQQLVYNLCYTYARCTRSVSYATPAYYADRLATRACLYLNSDADDAASAYSSHSGASADEQRRVKMTEYRQKLKAIHANHAAALFYM